MRPRFAETKNYRTFAQSYQALRQRGAGEACLMVVDGIPGLGKTEALEWFAVQNHNPMIRALPGWTPNWFLRDLLTNLNKPHEHSGERMFKQAAQALADRYAAAEADDLSFALIVDEVDHICRNGDVLETLRGLSDKIEMPVVLVGMDKVRHKLVKFQQIASRVGQYVEFTPAPLEDTQLLISEICEVKVEAKLVALIHEASKGCFREVMEAIATCERVGRRHDGKVGIAEMSGKTLMNHRDTGRPIVVRA